MSFQRPWDLLIPVPCSHLFLFGLRRFHAAFFLCLCRPTNWLLGPKKKRRQTAAPQRPSAHGSFRRSVSSFLQSGSQTPSVSCLGTPLFLVPKLPFGNQSLIPAYAQPSLRERRRDRCVNPSESRRHPARGGGRHHAVPCRHPIARD